MYTINKLTQFLVLTTLVLISVCGCSKKPDAANSQSDSGVNASSMNAPSEKAASDANNPGSPSERPANKPQDKPLAEFQIKLLDTAFEVACSIPKEPFVKDRCLAQEKVVDTCLKLDQPIKALLFANQIDDWRRGLCYANIAYYLALKGDTKERIEKGLHLAEQIAALDHGQKWRSDRIKARIAQVYTVLGQPEKAEPFRKDLVDSESGQVEATEAKISVQDDFDQHIQTLDGLVALFGFDTTISALHGYAQLFNRFYDNPERRALAEEKIKKAWTKVPLPIKMDILTELTNIAIAHKDHQKAAELINQMRIFLDEYQWPLENYIPVCSKVIELNYQIGNTQTAKDEAEKLVREYDEKYKGITDIYRAGALRPLAEACRAIGQTDLAMAVYKKALEAGNQNPNSRPRAEDLSATCSSIALSGTEPDDESWNLIHSIQGSLQEPW